tara:strand:- start:350 stop:613 length:264 start_codon:yes stop_codon:yes gene_type:complete
MAEIKGDSMGKQKDFLIDWLEDVGYEMGYDLENYRNVDKLTVMQYLRDAYIVKDRLKRKNEERQKRIALRNQAKAEHDALIEHLKGS